MSTAAPLPGQPPCGCSDSTCPCCSPWLEEIVRLRHVQELVVRVPRRSSIRCSSRDLSLHLQPGLRTGGELPGLALTGSNLLVLLRHHERTHPSLWWTMPMCFVRWPYLQVFPWLARPHGRAIQPAGVLHPLCFHSAWFGMSMPTTLLAVLAVAFVAFLFCSAFAGPGRAERSLHVLAP